MREIQESREQRISDLEDDLAQLESALYAERDMLELRKVELVTTETDLASFKVSLKCSSSLYVNLRLLISRALSDPTS